MTFGDEDGKEDDVEAGVGGNVRVTVRTVYRSFISKVPSQEYHLYS